MSLLHRRRGPASGAAACVALLVLALQAAVPDRACAADLPGQAKAEDNRCLECHKGPGHGGERVDGEEGRIARLGGQRSDYLVKQLRDFRSGARKHEIMSVMARDLEDADIRDLAAFFASRPPAAGDHQVSESGSRLYLQGDAQRGLAACSSCHGDAAQGGIPSPAPAGSEALAGPRLAGQSRLYLQIQLHAWRGNERKNSPQGAMSAAARGLSDQDIDDLADYLASR